MGWVSMVFRKLLSENTINVKDSLGETLAVFKNIAKVYP